MEFILRLPLPVIAAAMLILDIVWAFVSQYFDVSRNKRFIWQMSNEVLAGVVLFCAALAFLIDKPTVASGVDLEFFHLLRQAGSDAEVFRTLETVFVLAFAFGLVGFWALSPRLVIPARMIAVVVLALVVGVLFEITQYYAMLGSAEADIVLVYGAGALVGALTGVARAVMNGMKLGPKDNYY